MPTIVGGLMALIALSSSIIKGVEPLECLIRGLVAFVIGKILTHLWESLVKNNTILLPSNDFGMNDPPYMDDLEMNDHKLENQEVIKEITASTETRDKEKA